LRNHPLLARRQFQLMAAYRHALLVGIQPPLLAARQRPILVVNAAYYAGALGLVLWALLVMLRAAFPDHADGLWVLSFAHDVWHGLPLHGWQMPGAPLYFPELTTVLITTGLGFGVRSTLLIYGMLTWLAIGAGVYAGLRVRGVERSRALESAAGALLVYLLLNCGSGFLQTFEFPFSHGGSVLVAFLSIVYLGHGLERGFGRVSSVAFAAAIGLSSASDRAVLAQLMPVSSVLALLLLTRTGPRARLSRALALLVIGGAIGTAITLLIHWRSGLEPGSVRPHLGLEASWHTLASVQSNFAALIAERPYFGASIVLPVLFSGWRVLSALGERWLGPREEFGSEAALPVDLWFASAGLAAITGTLAAVVVSNVWSQRYVLPVYVLPLAFGVIIGVPLQPKLPRAWLRAIELGLLFVGVMVARHTDRNTSHARSTLITPTRACLDHYFAEQGLSAGYAGYWQSRPQMLLSQTPVTLAQVHGRLQPHTWASNAYWRTRGYWPGQGPPRFSFAINPGLDEEWLTARFGEPRTKQSCFGEQIWVYDRPQDLEFRNYVRSESALATGDREGWWPLEGANPGVAQDTDDPASDGEQSLVVQVPHVHANVLEIVSPTRQALELSYQRGGAEIAAQEVSFPSEARRLVAIPPGLDPASVDTLSISARENARFRVKRLALMWDPEAERARH
jgi:hypothetical protein